MSWRLDLARARRCRYVVCTRNGHPPTPAQDEKAPEPHRSAFLVGTIKNIVPTPDPEEHVQGRWLIQIDRYARVDLPEVWPYGNHYPVHYCASLDELGIDPAGLEFRDMPPAEEASGEPRPFAQPAPRLTVDEAKRGLAAAFGVPEAAIEITIRM
jgi:hypothetical protein